MGGGASKAKQREQQERIAAQQQREVLEAQQRQQAQEKAKREAEERRKKELEDAVRKRKQDAEDEKRAAAQAAAEAKYKALLTKVQSANCKESFVGVQVLTSRDQATSLDYLPECLLDLHDGMPASVSNAPMRLLKVDAVLSWPTLRVYEEVQPDECIDVPYSDVNEDTWAQTAVLSWRWAEGKPAELRPGFSPMSPAQFHNLCTVLQHAVQTEGLTHVWVDWCCVPQYSANPMVEVLRSKVFYARAHTMIVVPTFFPLPATGVVRLLLAKAARLMRRRAPTSARSGVAAAVVDSMLAKEMVAGREYFGRVWTLAERLARYGRKERLSQWLSLEAWLGMVVDAMLRAVEDKSASQIYKKMLGGEASRLLDDILGPLEEAVRTASMMVSEGLEEKVAGLFELVVERWLSTNGLEEAPTKSWLLSYMEEAESGVYQASNEGDRVWAVYTYFCWKQLDQQSEGGLLEALRDLVKVAGGERKHLASMAAQLGVGHRALSADDLAANLLVAAEGGVVEEVESLLAAGANVDAADRMDGETGLHKASRKGHTAVVALLLKREASVDKRNKSDSTPLLVAALNDNADVISALVAEGADKDATKDGDTALHIASSEGNIEACKVLVAAGCSVTKINHDDNMPLHLAAMHGHLEACKELMAAGAPLEHRNKDGYTPLRLAVDNNKLDVITAMLAKGADKDAAGKDGNTALHIASKEGQLEACKSLIAAGCSTAKTNNNDNTPLHLAAMHGHVEACRVLMAAGAPLEHTNDYGNTPLHLAATDGHVEVCTELVAAGAPLEHRNKDGNTPLRLATKHGRTEAIRVLTAAGAPLEHKAKNGHTP